MRKIILLTTLLLVFGSYVIGNSHTETFYVSAFGDGSIPESNDPATCYDAADFNTSGNWDTDDSDDGKIGPNDCVVILDDHGPIRATLTVQQTGLSAKPITIMGEDGGDAVVSGSDTLASDAFVSYGGNIYAAAILDSSFDALVFELSNGTVIYGKRVLAGTGSTEGDSTVTLSDNDDDGYLNNTTWNGTFVIGYNGTREAYFHIENPVPDEADSCVSVEASFTSENTEVDSVRAHVSAQDSTGGTGPAQIQGTTAFQAALASQTTNEVYWGFVTAYGGTEVTADLSPIVNELRTSGLDQGDYINFLFESDGTGAADYAIFTEYENGSNFVSVTFTWTTGDDVTVNLNENYEFTINAAGDSVLVYYDGANINSDHAHIEYEVRDYGIVINGKDHITVYDITFERFAKDLANHGGSGIFATACENLIVQYCEFKEIYYVTNPRHYDSESYWEALRGSGLRLDNTITDCLITGNIFTDTGVSGVVIDQRIGLSTRIEISYNTFENNEDHVRIGIGSDLAGLRISQLNIHHNSFGNHNAYHYSSSWHPDKLQFWTRESISTTAIDSVEIHKNHFFDTNILALSGNSSVFIEGYCHAFDVHDNIFQNIINNVCFMIDGPNAGDHAGGHRIYNNAAHLHADTTSVQSFLRLLKTRDTAYWNNLIDAKDGANSLRSDEQSDSLLVWDYNMSISDSTTGANHYRFDTDLGALINDYTLAELRLNRPDLAEHDIEAQPIWIAGDRFTSYVDSLFALSALETNAINGGTEPTGSFSGVRMTDYFENPIEGLHDIGALEYQSPESESTNPLDLWLIPMIQFLGD